MGGGFWDGFICVWARVIKFFSESTKLTTILNFKAGGTVQKVQVVMKKSARWLCMPMPQEGGEGYTISPEGRVKQLQVIMKISARWLCMPMPQEGGEGSTISPEGRVNISSCSGTSPG